MIIKKLISMNKLLQSSYSNYQIKNLSNIAFIKFIIIKMLSSRQSVTDQSTNHRPTQKQVTNLLVKIEGIPHQLKNYRQLLMRKQQFERTNENVSGGFQRLDKIIDPKMARLTYTDKNIEEGHEAGGMCPVCYEQIRGKGLKCDICRNQVCRNCLARNRIMKNGTISKFCQNCDKKQLQAQISKYFLRDFLLYQKAFQTLVRQQQNLQALLNMQKKQIKSQQISQQRKLVIKNDQRIRHLKRQKQNNRQKVHQVQNKIIWGQSMTKNLRVKHRKLKKLFKQSFGSSNSDAPYLQWQPPKAEDDIDLQLQNINQSFITANLQKSLNQEDLQGVNDKQLCRCHLM